MPHSLSREQVREIDRRAIQEFGLPGIALMENAGRNAAELIQARFPSGPAVILCGKGNNGGDGFVIARHLQLAGREPQILLAAAADEFGGDAGINFTVVAGSGLVIEPLAEAAEATWRQRLAGAAVIVDCILGTGAAGSPRGAAAVAINAINATRDAAGATRVVAIDLPSGLDCDSGEAPGACVRADLTISFVAAKRGFENPSAGRFTGEVVVAGIGAPRCLLEAAGCASARLSR